MRNILPGKLWIANARQVRDIRSVLAEGVTAIIDLAMEEPPIAFPRDILYARFPLLDGSGNERAVLNCSVLSLVELIQDERPTVVACSGGMSRSPIITAAALAQVNKISLESAVQQVTASGPHDLSPGLLSEVAMTFPDASYLASRPNLLVIRTSEPSRLVAFYEQLGLTFQEERHGSGPLHWSTTVEQFVFEIYPRTEGTVEKPTTSIGFNVVEVDNLLAGLTASGTDIVRQPESMEWGRQAIVRDPDGRTVILVQPEQFA
ncbi:VOC family protein [Bremerella sp. JC817]|uniref:VOC family protein n=1 Tax=Bremerella sp. JC817 TaxID=3231756 RepID=UPI003459EBE0